MERFFKGNIKVYIAIFLSVFILDITTKYLAETILRNRDIDVLPFLKLTLVYNKGVAFGLFSELPDIIRKPFLIISSLLGILISFIYAFKVNNKTVSAIMGAIGGGALGNLYDRALLGQVRDFIYLHYGNYYWPAFNIADASITISIILFVVHSFINQRRG